jgi:hypothetical protein
MTQQLDPVKMLSLYTPLNSAVRLVVAKGSTRIVGSKF